MADSVERFVGELAHEVEVPGVDQPGAAAVRCANLRDYLEPRVGARLALIGEAPSTHSVEPSVRHSAVLMAGSGRRRL